ncbi:hypothetical protein QKU48_gp0069 [Fadolivirus algeromassiliense]|jgi:hypothetical protein|uniref:Uncharacterized protein n=1 Tax=Fadolivirus FV1/VV64 TaxID=3070911 RepID=A0A7D3QTR2_9VIRU|nr:hypothetical protein QKU48_gp0069 [Fadolivirus algeromassiliense]QKF93527.1 hypothetical protein Fadolivirus_1_69 [Fadolivirus FV1/VV64]
MKSIFLILLTIIIHISNTKESDCEVSDKQYCCSNSCKKCEICFKNYDDFIYYITINPYSFDHIIPPSSQTNILSPSTTPIPSNTSININNNTSTTIQSPIPTNNLVKRDVSNTTVLPNITIPIIYLGCCSEYINYINISCTNITIDVCINTNYTKSKNNDFKNIAYFFTHAPVWTIVLVSVGLGAFILFLLYVCCCFGKRRPPLDYNLIIGKL